MIKTYRQIYSASHPPPTQITWSIVSGIILHEWTEHMRHCPLDSTRCFVERECPAYPSTKSESMNNTCSESNILHKYQHSEL